MESRHTPPTFLTLPVEIRLLIYEFLFETYNHPFILRRYGNPLSACRQMRREGLATWLGQTRYFGSCANLVKWTSRGYPALLPLVKSIDVDSIDGEVAGLVQELKSRLRRRHGGLPPAKNTGREQSDERAVTISTLRDTFLKLHGIRRIRIYFGAKHGKNLSADEELVMHIIARACPQMRELSFFSSPISLSFLSNLHQLRVLHFTGYTKSNPEKTLAILHKLPYLDTVIIFRYPASYDKDRGISTQELSKYLSFTPQVLCGLRPLKGFEVMHMASLPSTIVTPEMMDALLSHSATLKDLRIRADYECDAATLEKILKVIATAHLTRLDLSMILPPNYKVADVKRRIPKSLHQADIRLRKAKAIRAHTAQN